MTAVQIVARNVMAREHSYRALITLIADEMRESKKLLPLHSQAPDDNDKDQKTYALKQQQYQQAAKFARRQRRKCRDKTLSKSQEEAFMSIPGWSWVDQWEQQFENLVKVVKALQQLPQRGGRRGGPKDGC